MLAGVIPPGSLERLTIGEAQCLKKETVDLIMKVMSGVTSWQVQKLKLDFKVEAPMMKALNGITSWKVGKLKLGEKGILTSPMSNLRCETDGRLQCDSVWCWSSGGLSILCKILQTCNRWSLGELGLWSSDMTSDSWSNLAAVAGRGEIDKVRLNKSQIQRGRREDVEAVKRVTREWKEFGF